MTSLLLDSEDRRIIDNYRISKSLIHLFYDMIIGRTNSPNIVIDAIFHKDKINYVEYGLFGPYIKSMPINFDMNLRVNYMRFSTIKGKLAIHIHKYMHIIDNKLYITKYNPPTILQFHTTELLQKYIKKFSDNFNKQYKLNGEIMVVEDGTIPGEIFEIIYND